MFFAVIEQLFIVPNVLLDQKENIIGYATIVIHYTCNRLKRIYVMQWETYAMGLAPVGDLCNGEEK